MTAELEDDSRLRDLFNEVPLAVGKVLLRKYGDLAFVQWFITVMESSGYEIGKLEINPSGGDK